MADDYNTTKDERIDYTSQNWKNRRNLVKCENYIHIYSLQILLKRLSVDYIWITLIWNTVLYHRLNCESQNSKLINLYLKEITQHITWIFLFLLRTSILFNL